MSDTRKKMPDELGEVDIGDIIVGRFYKKKLIVESKRHEYDDVYTYNCKYLEGSCEGQYETIMSYQNYTKVVL